MAIYVMKCSSCDNEIQVYDPKAQAWHIECPNRTARQAPPEYKHTTK